MPAQRTQRPSFRPDGRSFAGFSGFRLGVSLLRRTLPPFDRQTLCERQEEPLVKGPSDPLNLQERPSEAPQSHRVNPLSRQEEGLALWQLWLAHRQGSDDSQGSPSRMHAKFVSILLNESQDHCCFTCALSRLISWWQTALLSPKGGLFT